MMNSSNSGARRSRENEIEATSENFLTALMRTNNDVEQSNDNRFRSLDPPIVTDYGLLIIDWLKCKVTAINEYIYRLSSLVLLRSDDGNSSNNNGANRHGQAKNLPRIIIFDGLNSFDVITFKSILSDSTCDRMYLTREPNPLKLLGSISKYLTEQAALNKFLKLVVIYCDDMYIQDLMNFLVSHMENFKFHLVLISYLIPSRYRRCCSQGKIPNLAFLQPDFIGDHLSVEKIINKNKRIQATFSLSRTNESR
ncbi:uncharacterized protein LOC141856103 [Brevipalpus obovatus]|uniref:uncharacterized protein LOC141856103 n=1 Tax=Brevipalpus obovatus TaxID=246614 RepID=UPI003D9DF674